MSRNDPLDTSSLPSKRQRKWSRYAPSFTVLIAGIILLPVFISRQLSRPDWVTILVPVGAAALFLLLYYMICVSPALGALRTASKNGSAFVTVFSMPTGFLRELTRYDGAERSSIFGEIFAVASLSEEGITIWRGETSRVFKDALISWSSIGEVAVGVAEQSRATERALVLSARDEGGRRCEFRLVPYERRWWGLGLARDDRFREILSRFSTDSSGR